MDVKEQGLMWLWVRVLKRGSVRERERVNRFYDKWIEQVKMTERELEKAHESRTT